jgi:competence protein ComEC
VRRPLLALAACFALGVLACDREAGPAGAAATLILSGALLALASVQGEGRAAVAALAAAALGLGHAGAGLEALGQSRSALRRAIGEAEGTEAPTLRVAGRARGDGLVHDGRLVLGLDVERVDRRGEWRPIRGRLRLEVGGDTPHPRVRDADRLVVSARVRPAEGAAAARQGIDGYAWCKSSRLVHVSPPDGTAPVREAAAGLRERVRGAIARHVLASTERGLVLAMVIGDRSLIDEATAESFRAAGTYHVLALSGAQVALLAGLLVVALRLLLVRPWLQATAATALVAFYAVLVGADVPVVRAAVMAVAVLAGRAIEVDSDATNLLGLAGLLLLVHRPAAVTDVGFQLSFGATLGILLLTGPLTEGVPRLPLRAELGTAASAAAQLALVPVQAAAFHRLSPAAVLLNLAAVPLSSAVLLLGLAVLLLDPVAPRLAGLAGDAAWVAARALRVSSDLGPLAPSLDLRVAGPSTGLVLLHACGLSWLARRRRAAGLVALLAVPLHLAFAAPRADADGRLHLTVIDVGQGDALLLRSPSGRALLVDAGGSREGRYDPGERRVGPELWRRRVRRLDALLVTHAHPDHVGGAPFVIRAFEVAERWEGPAPLRDAVWKAVEARLAVRPAVRRTLAAGMTLHGWDGVRLRVLGPPRPRRPPWRVRNEDSVVLEVRFGDVSFLLTGDVGGEAEEAFDAPPGAVLKVAHHGSRSSSANHFLARASPRLALVSAGAHNPFGHPHPETLRRLERTGALVLRTDRDGTIRVATDGERVFVRTEAQGEERRIR